MLAGLKAHPESRQDKTDANRCSSMDLHTLRDLVTLAHNLAYALAGYVVLWRLIRLVRPRRRRRKPRMRCKR